MKSFKCFLAEKVSRTEISIALRNRDVIVGGEFEIIVSRDTDAFDNALSAWRDWERNYREWYHEYLAYEERESETHYALSSTGEELEELLGIRNNRTEYEVKPSEEYFEFMRIVANVGNPIIDPKGEETEFVFEPDNEDIVFSQEITVSAPLYARPLDYEEFVRQDNIIVRTERERLEMALTAEDAWDEYQHTRKELIELHEKWEKAVEGRDLLEHPGNCPEPDSDYFYYMTDYFSREELSTTEEIGNMGTEVEIWVEPSSDMLPEGDAAEETIRTHIEDSLSPLANADVRYGSYHSSSQSVGDRFWRVESDASLNEGGIEIISPPMPLPEFLTICQEMFDWIGRVGTTDSSCGFHIHMSLKNVQMSRTLNVIKLILLTDEEYIYQHFDERRGNKYAASSRKQIDRLSQMEIENLFDIKALTDRLVREKYSGINLMHLDKDRIEFRYLGGPGYDRKFSEIQMIIGHYAHNLLAACSETYLQREYYIRLNRLKNVINLAKKMTQLKQVENIMGTIDSVMVGNAQKPIALIGMKLMIRQLKRDIAIANGNLKAKATELTKRNISSLMTPVNDILDAAIRKGKDKKFGA